MTDELHAFRARQKSIKLEEVAHIPLDVAYTDVGSGEVVVLLHGIPTWSYLYHDVIPLLERQCRVLAPDFLGHGYSDQRDRFDRSLVTQAHMILRFLDALEVESATIVGHDTGGGVALILAIEHPKRVKRLVLTNAVAYDSWPIGDMIALGNPAWREKPSSEIVDFVTSGLSEGLHNPERLTAAFARNIVAPYSDEQGKISLIRNASALNTNHTTALIDRHKHINAPTLVLWGIHDPWQTIADGEQLAKDIPNAKLVRLENASHWLQQDAPDKFAYQILKFIEAM